MNTKLYAQALAVEDRLIDNNIIIHHTFTANTGYAVERRCDTQDWTNNKTSRTTNGSRVAIIPVGGDWKPECRMAAPSHL
jgi:hypothetical protein